MNMTTNIRHRNGLFDLLFLTWRWRRWFYAILALMLSAVTVIVFLSDPVYVSSSLITPKGQKNGGDLLSQFRLGTSGSGGDLGKMEVYLTSQELAEQVVERVNLLPALYPDRWDEDAREWKGTPPTLRRGARILLREHLAISPDIRKGRIEINVMFRDSLRAHAINEAVLQVLNEKMQRDIIQEAEANQQYLEKQFAQTSNPLLMQKITTLIASQIESAMLISGNSFETLLPPSYPFGKDWPKPKLLFVIGVFLSIFAYVALIVCVFFYRELRAEVIYYQKARED